MKNKIFIVITILVMFSSLLVFWGCNNEKSDEYKVDEDMEFAIDSATNIFNVPVNLFLDLNESKIILRADGTVQMRFIIKNNISLLLNSFVNEDTLQSINIVDAASIYLPTLFPTMDLTQLQAALNILEESMNFALLGFDFDDPNTIALEESLSTTGMLPSDFQIPSGLGIEYNGNYYMKNVVSEYSGEHTGVYVGNAELDEKLFTIMTMTDNEDNTAIKCLSLRIEFIKLVLFANEK